MKLQQYFVYIMSNTYNRVFYIGITGNLLNRVEQHKTGMIKGFARDYNLHKLVYFEVWDTAEAAIAREKQLKRWHRQWKINLIKELNPAIEDLTGSL